MRKDDAVRLFHMLEAAQEAVSFAENKTRADLNIDRKLVLALVKDIEIIGEAAANVTAERRRELMQIPWNKIVGMRNRLIHAYFEIDLDVLWKTITEDILPLISALEKIVPTD
jgi:uncharacterized protein with HEPN domain